MIVSLRPVFGFALLCSLLFTPTTSAQSRPPVILVDGGQDCSTPRTFGFGQLEARLTDRGIRTELFRPCSVTSKSGGQRPFIEELAEALAARIDELASPEVDVIAFSLGGPIVRCYLSGKQTTPGMFKPPTEHKVRKVVFLGTGQFGGWLEGANIPAEEQALIYGSRFQWDLANWNQGHDLLRQIDAVALVAFAGEGVTNLTIEPSPETDGVVSMVSGSLSFAYPAERTRIIPGCHLRGWCLPGVAYVSSDLHPAWIVVDSFLSGTDGWKTVGHAPDQDLILSAKGGVMVGVKDAWDNLIQDAQVSISGRAMWKGVAGDSIGTFVVEHIETGEHTLQASASFPVPDKAVTVKAGTFTVVTMKPGPLLADIQIADSEPRSSNITAGAIVSIYGERLADGPVTTEAPFPTTLGSTTVKVNDRPIPLLSVSESQIKAQLPDDVTGYARLTVTSDKGAHSLNLFIRGKASQSPVITEVANAWSGQAPIGDAGWIYVKGTSLAQTTRIWSNDEIVNGKLPTALDGVGVKINNNDAYVYYISPTQINVQAPSDGAVGAVPVRVVNSSGASPAFSVNKQTTAPAVFVWPSGTAVEGNKYVGALTTEGQQVVYIGKTGLLQPVAIPTRPARPNEIVLLFVTACGPTVPPFAAGQVVTAPVPTLVGPVNVAIGGIPALVAGGTGYLIFAGECQFNVTIPPSVPDGDLLVELEIGGVKAQSNIYITVQK